MRILTPVYVPETLAKSGRNSSEDLQDDRLPANVSDSAQAFQKLKTSLPFPSRMIESAEPFSEFQADQHSATEERIETVTGKIDLHHSNRGQNSSFPADELHANNRSADPRLRHASYHRRSSIAANPSIVVRETSALNAQSLLGVTIPEPQLQSEINVTPSKESGSQESRPLESVQSSAMALDDQRRVRPKCPRCDQKELFNSAICKTCRESEQETQTRSNLPMDDGRSASPASSAFSTINNPQAPSPSVISDVNVEPHASSFVPPKHRGSIPSTGQGTGLLKRPSAEDSLFLPRKKSKLIIPGITHAGAARKTIVPSQSLPPEERPMTTMVESPVDMQDERCKPVEQPAHS